MHEPFVKKKKSMLRLRSRYYESVLWNCSFIALMIKGIFFAAGGWRKWYQLTVCSGTVPWPDLHKKALPATMQELWSGKYYFLLLLPLHSLSGNLTSVLFSLNQWSQKINQNAPATGHLSLFFILDKSAIVFHKKYLNMRV